MIVVRLVVFVPVITRLDAVEVPRFSGAELIVPPVRLTDTWENNVKWAPEGVRVSEGKYQRGI